MLVAWKFWVANRAGLKEQALLLAKERCQQRDEEIAKLAGALNSTEGDSSCQFENHLRTIFKEEVLLDGYHLNRIKLVRLFELATSMEELDSAWSMWRINRINRSEPQIDVSDAVIGHALRAFLQANKPTANEAAASRIEHSNSYKLLSRIKEELNMNCLDSGQKSNKFDRAIGYVMNFVADRDMYGLTASEWMLQWLLKNTSRLDLGLGIYRALEDFGYLEHGTLGCNKNALASLLEICASNMPNDSETYEMILRECEEKNAHVPSFHWVRCAALYAGKNDNNAQILIEKFALLGNEHAANVDKLSKIGNRHNENVDNLHKSLNGNAGNIEESSVSCNDGDGNTNNAHPQSNEHENYTNIEKLKSIFKVFSAA